MQDVKGKLFRNSSGLGLALTLTACVSGTGQQAGAPASPSQQEGASDSGDIPIEEKIFIDGTGSAEIDLAQARLDETLAKISAVESEISRLENLRRIKL